MAQWYNPFWDAGTSKKVLGSNPVECRWNSCWPSANELDLGVATACQVRSALVFQKRKKCGYKQLYTPWGHLVNWHKKQVPHHQTMYFGPIDKPNCLTKVSLLEEHKVFITMLYHLKSYKRYLHQHSNRFFIDVPTWSEEQSALEAFLSQFCAYFINIGANGIIVCASDLYFETHYCSRWGFF
jgi:hypothetical protein